jgi:hypothetical protein
MILSQDDLYLIIGRLVVENYLLAKQIQAMGQPQGFAPPPPNGAQNAETAPPRQEAEERLEDACQ